MVLTSSVPPLEFTEAGLVVPEESAVLAGVQADIDAAFGGGLNPALETPQGQLASSESAIIGDKNNEFAYYVNQVDPRYSEGRFQDAIARIYFLNRKPAIATSVTVTIGGLPGTVIPVGTLAQDTSGNIYTNSGTVTIGAASVVEATFQNLETGPIPCPAATLTQVYQAIPGWDTITNDDPGVMGSVVESRADFEYRRQNSVEINANGTPGAIYASVFDLPGVLDAYVIDNPTGATVMVGSTSYPVIEHSVYVAVVGGVDADIARAIWTKKDLGCDMNGNTTVVVTDNSGYNFPQPSYSIKFNRPDALPLLFAVEIVDDPSLPSNIVALVKAAILARFSGADGTSRERIGSAIFASRYYAPVSLVSTSAAVVSILIGTVTATLPRVDVGIDEQPTLSESDITVTLV
jgi:uncharacterized phage protein gp47/JayE